jgi:hypothetical protein
MIGSLLDGNSGTSYKGAWDASTNTPNIADGSGVNGDYYLVSIAGTQDLGSGSIDFTSGDDVRYNGTIWQKIEGGVNYVPEDVANKATDFSTINDVKYPTTKAVKDQLDLKIGKVVMTDNAVPRANGTDGTLQNSLVTISDLGAIAAGGFSSTGSISSDSSITAGGSLNVSRDNAGSSRLRVLNLDTTSTSDATLDIYAAGGNVTQAFSNNSNDIVWGLDKADNNFKMTWDYNFASGFFLKVNPSGQINLPLIVASKPLGLDAQKNIVSRENQGMELIQAEVLAVDTATLTFSVPSGFRSLRMVGLVRSTRTSTLGGIAPRFNGDTGLNYTNQILVGNNSSAGASVNVNQNRGILADIPAAFAPANAAGAFTWDIPDYANPTFHKNSVSTSTMTYANAANSRVEIWSNYWAVSAVISSIELKELYGWNFKSGSSFYLYGIY